MSVLSTEYASFVSLNLALQNADGIRAIAGEDY